MSTSKRLTEALWNIYRRPEKPVPWSIGNGNLPWNDPIFSQRMLREHLDQSHGAATRIEAERAQQIEWLWSSLGLQAGMQILDVTCGPGFYAVGLATRGCTVTGIDFSPASIEHARALALAHHVAERCTFVEEDVKQVQLEEAAYDAALFLYGQLAVFPKHEAAALLRRIARTLKPGGQLCIELLSQDRVDKNDSSWWYTDDTGLWGDAPFLHLGERMWDAEKQMSLERFYVLHLTTGEFTEILLCDQTYASDEMVSLLRSSGFGKVTIDANWADLPLNDADEWVIYTATR